MTNNVWHCDNIDLYFLKKNYIKIFIRFFGRAHVGTYREIVDVLRSFRSQNDLSPSSARPEKRVDAYFDHSMPIYRNNIDYCTPGNNPWALCLNMFACQKKEHIIPFKKYKSI